MMAQELKCLALIGCGDERYRSYLLEQISEGYDIWLIDTAEPTWQRTRLRGATRIEAFRPDLIEAAVADLMQDGGLDGIVCWDERYVLVAADCAALFRLPTPGALGIRGCRDKALCRTRLTEAGLPQPRSRQCYDAEDAASFAETVGYSCVVKPRDMGGSIGVALVTGPADLRQAFGRAQAASRSGSDRSLTGVLVEEFIAEGPEISIDGIYFSGRYTPLFVGRKSVGMAPFFEEIAHLVDAADPLLDDAVLRDVLNRAHAAICFGDGITHTELKLTANGPVIIEINGRLGGDFIPWLATLAMGMRPGLLAGQVAAGDPVTLPSRGAGRGCAAIAFRYPDRNLTVAEVMAPEARILGLAQGSATRLARPGDIVGLPPEHHLGRVGYAIAHGPDPADCVTLAASLATEFDWRAATPSGTGTTVGALSTSEI
ncbi:MAG: ATP-grasp domain-containing protein [Aestuariivirga sp.]|uniref:ATP-grasp domain-containing protein n=1 Tax=Aestuariivirga sp. TaxID=2650926 RepID=UPI0025C34923|nr:ATP-grasp domain-containing protein [Aestuariivirga sp.]MCA3560000.1 ATP-grasp domain-containing protein [Aestuariivirga sp.]